MVGCVKLRARLKISGLDVGSSGFALGPVGLEQVVSLEGKLEKIVELEGLEQIVELGDFGIRNSLSSNQILTVTSHTPCSLL